MKVTIEGFIFVSVMFLKIFSMWIAQDSIFQQDPNFTEMQLGKSRYVCVRSLSSMSYRRKIMSPQHFLLV